MILVTLNISNSWKENLKFWPLWVVMSWRFRKDVSYTNLQARDPSFFLKVSELGGGFKDFVFSPWGNDPTWLCFQVGWNHQLENIQTHLPATKTTLKGEEHKYNLQSLTLTSLAMVMVMENDPSQHGRMQASLSPNFLEFWAGSERASWKTNLSKQKLPWLLWLNWV